MSARTRSAAAFVVSLTLTTGATSVALAQPAPAGAPAAATTGGNASVADAIAGFGSGDREKVVAARQALIARLSGNPPATTLNALAHDLGTGIMPIVNGNDPHAKLNAAIAIQRVADQTGSIDLAPAIAKLIRDESPAIASFGLRASVNVLPRVMSNPVTAENNTLLPAIYDALAKHATNEAVAVDVYTALTKLLASSSAETVLGPNGVREATPRIVDALLKVIAARVTDFGTGTVAEPGAEGQQAVGFLARASTWQLMNDDQKTRTVGALLALLDGAAEEMVAVKDPQTVGRPKMDGLRALLKFTAQGLGVIANLANKSAELRTASDKIQTVNLSTTPAQVAAIVNEIEAAYGAQFPGAVTQTTQPATQATVP